MLNPTSTVSRKCMKRYVCCLESCTRRVKDDCSQSGLFRDYDSTPPAQRLSLSQVEKRICNYLRKHRIRRGVLAGAGVAFDRAMVASDFPPLHNPPFFLTNRLSPFRGSTCQNSINILDIRSLIQRRCGSVKHATIAKKTKC